MRLCSRTELYRSTCWSLKSIPISAVGSSHCTRPSALNQNRIPRSRVSLSGKIQALNVFDQYTPCCGPERGRFSLHSEGNRGFRETVIVEKNNHDESFFRE